jgi:hypothetical protein
MGDKKRFLFVGKVAHLSEDAVVLDDVHPVEELEPDVYRTPPSFNKLKSRDGVVLPIDGREVSALLGRHVTIIVETDTRHKTLKESPF